MIENTKNLKQLLRESEIHHNGTGFIRDVCETEEVLDDIKQYMATLPAYDPKFFRVVDSLNKVSSRGSVQPCAPESQEDLPHGEVLARLYDNSEHMS